MRNDDRGVAVATVTAQQVAGNAPPDGPARVDTPLRLWLMLIIAVAVILAAGSVAGVSMAGRESTAARSAQSTEALYADLQDLSYDLADANATAATSLLSGAETASQFSTRFQVDLAGAEGLLSEASQQVSGDAYASAELTTLAGQIPYYTELVGQAQTENGFGYPVAGAYLRQASDLLKMMLAESGKVIAEQERATESGIGSASSFTVPSLGVVLLALLALWLIGRRVARSTHRRLNPGLIGGAAVVLGLFAWSLTSFSTASGDANLASADFSGVVAAQTQTSELSLAETNVALQQIDRGEDQGGDATAATKALGLADPQSKSAVPADEATLRATAVQAYVALDACAQQAIGLATGGQYVAATTKTVGSGASVGQGGCEPLAISLYNALEQLDAASQAKFNKDMSSLAGDYGGSAALPIGLVAALIGAGVAAYGLDRRLAEYR